MTKATQQRIADALMNHFNDKSTTPKFELHHGKVWLEKTRDGTVQVRFEYNY
jgi:hypothetical protein